MLGCDMPEISDGYPNISMFRSSINIDHHLRSRVFSGPRVLRSCGTKRRICSCRIHILECIFHWLQLLMVSWYQASCDNMLRNIKLLTCASQLKSRGQYSNSRVTKHDSLLLFSFGQPPFLWSSAKKKNVVP